MGILANTRRGQHMPGRWVMMPKEPAHAPKRRRSRVVHRRRQNFLRLLVAAIGTLVLGLIPSLRVLLIGHLAVDAALVAYVFQLRRWRRIELERARVVRTLARPAPPDDEPAPQVASQSS